jgi:hypothetical protein
MRKFLKKQGFAPSLLVTDKLPSYALLDGSSVSRLTMSRA